MKSSLANSRPLKLPSFYFLTLVCLVFAVIFLSLEHIYSESLFSDEGLYMWYGKRLVTNFSLVLSNEITFPHPPLFAMILALAHCTPDPVLTSRLIVLSISILGILLVYYLGTGLKSRFVGLVSAIMLAFNFGYFTTSTLILTDILFMFTALLVMIGWYKASQGLFAGQVMVAIAAAALIMLKWYGVLVLPWIVVSYWLVRQQLPNARLKMRIMFFVPLIFFLLWAVHDYLLKGYVLSSFVPVEKRPALEVMNRFAAVSANAFTGLHGLALFFISGVLLSFKKEERMINIVLLPWILIITGFLLVLSLRVESRFVIYMLPGIFILSAIGIEKFIDAFARASKISERRLKYLAVLFLFSAALTVNSIYRPITELVWGNFGGYSKAAEIVRTIVKPGDLIVAASERQMRYYTNINLKEFGGQIIPFRQEKAEFEQLVRNNSGVILETDLWEVLQPSWMRQPFSQTTQEYLLSLGFRSAGMVHRSGNGTPVVEIYRKE